MNKKLKQRQVNGGNTNGKDPQTVERAITDGAWRSRPLWRAMRPDHDYGPKLTAAARRLLAQERDYADRH